MQGFQGHGYSVEFNENMSKIIQHLKSNLDQIIEITDDLDVICKCCPHNKNGKCKNLISNWMIKKVDRKVIQKLKIDYGTKISFKDAILLINQIFKTQKDFEEICANCRWKEKCLWYISKPES
jgi:hypothetical protein